MKFTTFIREEPPYAFFNDTCVLCLKSYERSVVRSYIWSLERTGKKIKKRLCPSCHARLRDYFSDGRGFARECVRVRDNHTCKDCGKRRTREEVTTHNAQIVGLPGRMKAFDVHHLNGECGKNSRGYDRVEDIPTLITLCHTCHFNRHDFNPKSKKRMGNRTKKI